MATHLIKIAEFVQGRITEYSSVGGLRLWNWEQPHLELNQNQSVATRVYFLWIMKQVKLNVHSFYLDGGWALRIIFSDGPKEPQCYNKSFYLVVLLKTTHKTLSYCNDAKE